MFNEILLVAHYFGDIEDKSNNRFNYIANLLAENGYNVEVVTSNFSHTKKKTRDYNKIRKNFKLTFLPEPGYEENISFKRIFSHYIFARNIRRYLSQREKPDLIYCAVPSLSVAKVVTKYSAKNNIKLILDIQDLWPEAFKMIFNPPLLGNLIYYPMHNTAKKIYASADAIISVSKEYSAYAKQFNKKSNGSHYIYIGTDLEYFDQFKKNNANLQKKKSDFWVTYVGTLGHSYDLKLVMDSLVILKSRGVSDIKLLVIGDGPLKEEFVRYSIERDLNVHFTGMLKYHHMIPYLVNSEISVNPIKKKSAASIINKHADYAAAGIPVINTQNSEEYQSLIDSYHAGINCKSGNPDEIADSIQELYYNERMRVEMGKNHRKLAEREFDRGKTYKKLIEIINNMGL